MQSSLTFGDEIVDCRAILKVKFNFDLEFAFGDFDGIANDDIADRRDVACGVRHPSGEEVSDCFSNLQSGAISDPEIRDDFVGGCGCGGSHGFMW